MVLGATHSRESTGGICGGSSGSAIYGGSNH